MIELHTLKECLNTDILLRVYSFLSKDTISRQCRYVCKHWETTIHKELFMLLMFILSIYIVSETIKENTHRKFSILQDAIDNCPNGATIVIKVILHVCFLYSPKRFVHFI